MLAPALLSSFLLHAAPLPAALAPAVAPAAPVPPVERDEGPTTLRQQRSVGSVLVDVLVWGRGDAEAVAAVDAAFDEGVRVVTSLATDRHDAPLARVNAAAGHEAVTVGAEVLDVLLTLRRLAQLSRGAYDPTAAIYDDAWPSPAGTGSSTATLPSRAELARRRRFVSFLDLALDPVTGTAKLVRDGARVDVAAVQKARVLDRMRAALVERGVTDFVLSSGGDVVVGGRRGDRPWRVGVQDPRGPDPFLALPVDPAILGGAVMTVSDNEDYFVTGGARYHSVLDPRTGLPSTRCRSVTVFADDALFAEALARAVFVLGDKDGLALVARVPGAQAVVVTADNRVALTRGLATMAAAQVLQQRAPTDGL
ncbi:MAG: FAD:protein FMN transferase [Deltaproteobacteria bacterium]|nr:FAD:protein FMN transferase [Deltaproteobacteria bacterium]